MRYPIESTLPTLRIVANTAIWPPGATLEGDVTPEIVKSGSSGAAASVTVTDVPAISNVPVRTAPPFGDAVNSTVPLAVPNAPDVIVIHETLLAADHAHPAVATTLIVPLPPVYSTNACCGDTVNWQF